MEEIRYFVMKPSIKLFGGLEVKKDTKFETDNDDKTVHQTLDNLKLTTKIKKDSEYEDEFGRKYKSCETSKLITELPEGVVLIWNEQRGFILPSTPMVTTEDAFKALEEIKSITDPIEEGTAKARGV